MNRDKTEKTDGKKRKLILRKESIRKLDAKDLAQVVGGGGGGVAEPPDAGTGKKAV